jgi:hypothetical protein
MLRKQGKFTDGNAPYGYYREPTDKHKLLVDANAAGIVRMIYEMYLDGTGVVRIAQKLTRLGIAPCSVYKKTRDIYLENDSKEKKSWPPRTVRNILSNKTYIGALDQKRQTTRNYKDKKVIYLDDSKHIIVYGSHEPIIPKAKFDMVQDELKKRCTKTSENKEKVYPLSGYLRCGECGYAMKRNPTFQKGRWYVYYKCKTYTHKGESTCKHSKCIREEILYETVLAIINLQIKTLINKKIILEEINSRKTNTRIWFNYNKMIKQKEKESEKYRQLKLECYMDWKNSSLSKEEYLFSKEEFDKKINEIKSDIQKLKNEYEQEEELRNKKIGWLDSIIKYGEIKELSRGIVVRLIEMIYVNKGNEIKVVFKYEDKFKKIAEYINTNSDINIGDKKYAAE